MKTLASAYVWEGSITVPIRLAGGESEGVLFFLKADQKKTITIQYDKKVDTDTSLQVFRVQNVTLEKNKAVPDPLIPFNNGAVAEISGLQLFYIKITALPSATHAQAERVVTFSDENGGSLSSVKLSVAVLPITLPTELPITVQASIWPYEKWPKDPKAKINELKSVLTFLARYRVNGVAGFLGDEGNVGIKKPYGDAATYYNFVEYCLDDLHFKRVRIPAEKRYSWKKPMSLDFVDGTLKGKKLEQRFREYLAPLDSIITNPKWSGKLGFKIWDEPREKDYPDVVLSYRAAKEAAPWLKLELSEEPDPSLQSVPDVWTPYLKFLKPGDVKEQHRLGKEVWIYANKVHGIDHPLYGMRILGWLLWEYELDGYLFWAVNWWQEDPWMTTSSQKTDYLKRGTLIYPDPQTDEIYPSLRLEAFRDGIEDMLLLMELDKVAADKAGEANEAKLLATKLRKVYGISERYDNAPDPAKFRNEILDVLLLGISKGATETR